MSDKRLNTMSIKIANDINSCKFQKRKFRSKRAPSSKIVCNLIANRIIEEILKEEVQSNG